MRRRFRLAAVERLRAGHLGDCARALAQARLAVTAAAEERATLADRLQNCVPDRLAGSADVRAVAARREQLRERLVAAGVRVEQAQEEAVRALAAWSAARSELKAVEALHERHREALRREDVRRDQLELDELAAARARRTTVAGLVGNGASRGPDGWGGEGA